MRNFVQSLFSHKLLIDNDIMLVLKDDRGEAQFKFWVHKHFKLVTIGELQVVYGIKSNNPVVEGCVCNGGCTTKKCPCKAAKVPCGTKCHPAKKKSCTNI